MQRSISIRFVGLQKKKIEKKKIEWVVRKPEKANQAKEEWKQNISFEDEKHSITYSPQIRLRQAIRPLYHYFSITIAYNHIFIPTFKNLGLNYNCNLVDSRYIFSAFF